MHHRSTLTDTQSQHHKEHASQLTCARVAALHLKNLLRRTPSPTARKPKLMFVVAIQASFDHTFEIAHSLWDIETTVMLASSSGQNGIILEIYMRST
jgi:hypothetical protein